MSLFLSSDRSNQLKQAYCSEKDILFPILIIKYDIKQTVQMLSLTYFGFIYQMCDESVTLLPELSTLTDLSGVLSVDPVTPDTHVSTNT